CGRATWAPWPPATCRAARPGPAGTWPPSTTGCCPPWTAWASGPPPKPASPADPAPAPPRVGPSAGPDPASAQPRGPGPAEGPTRRRREVRNPRTPEPPRKGAMPLPPAAVRRPLPEPVKSAVRAVADLAGQATRGRRALPDVLLAGAQRCGTTTLFRALLQHPRVLGPTLRKGEHYFDTGYGRGLDWYRGRFPTRRAVRAAGGGTGAVVCESSPYYLFHPLCAERIAADLPGVKVVVMLRDPVERAYSAHAHETARGYETQPF